MARPAKNVDVQSGEIRNDVRKKRWETENKLRGSGAAVKPSFAITKEQRKIFNKIKNLFDELDLLGELDCYVLTEGAVIIDRLIEIDRHINNEPDLLFDRDVCNTRKEYMQNFFRVCNELSLSPQARAKMGIMAAGKNAEKVDPILKIFGSEDDDG